MNSIFPSSTTFRIWEYHLPGLFLKRLSLYLSLPFPFRERLSDGRVSKMVLQRWERSFLTTFKSNFPFLRKLCVTFRTFGLHLVSLPFSVLLPSSHLPFVVVIVILLMGSSSSGRRLLLDALLASLSLSTVEKREKYSKKVVHLCRALFTLFHFVSIHHHRSNRCTNRSVCGE